MNCASNDAMRRRPEITENYNWGDACPGAMWHFINYTEYHACVLKWEAFRGCPPRMRERQTLSVAQGLIENDKTA